MRILASLFSCLLSLLILASCGARYTIGGESFSSSSEALQREKEILSHALADVSPTDYPLHGAALVVFPSDAEIQKNYITYTSSAVSQDIIDYLITAERNIFQFTVEAIRKRGIFDSVSVAQHNGNPTSYPMTSDYDYMIFRDVDGWFIKGRNSPTALQIAYDKRRNSGLAMQTHDKGRPDEVSHIGIFLDVLNRQAKVLSGK